MDEWQTTKDLEKGVDRKINLENDANCFTLSRSCRWWRKRL